MLMMTLFSNTNLQAQETESSKNNYVVVTNKVAQLQPIILTAEVLKAEEGNDFGNFEIIICGPEIGDITDAEKINKFIKKGHRKFDGLFYILDLTSTGLFTSANWL